MNGISRKSSTASSRRPNTTRAESNTVPRRRRSSSLPGRTRRHPSNDPGTDTFPAHIQETPPGFPSERTGGSQAHDKDAPKPETHAEGRGAGRRTRRMEAKRNTHVRAEERMTVGRARQRTQRPHRRHRDAFPRRRRPVRRGVRAQAAAAVARDSGSLATTLRCYAPPPVGGRKRTRYARRFPTSPASGRKRLR